MEFITPKAEVTLFATVDILTASPPEEATGSNCTTELPPDDF